MTQYGFYFDATRCTGCHTCEAACRDYHDLGLDFTFRHVYEIEGGGWNQASDGTWSTDSYTYYVSTSCQHCDNYHDLGLDFTFRHVYEIEGGGWNQASDGTWSTDSYTYYVSTSCQHCDNPACTHVCPTGAMHKGDDGIVSVDVKKCIGCGYCELACPYGNPKVDREKGHSTKCDGCASRLAEGKSPICVEACTMRALQFGPADEMAKKGHSTKCDGCASRLAEGKSPICVEACTMRALQFGPADEMAKLGERAALAPLPDPANTTPNLYVKACEHAKPSGSTDCVVANTAEVK